MDGTLIMIGIGFAALILAMAVLVPNLTSRSHDVRNPTDIES